MNSIVKINKQNADKSYSSLLPETITTAIFRDNTAKPLEEDLKDYDTHIVDFLNHVNHVTSSGSHRELSVSLSGVTLVDGLLLLLTLHTSLECSPTLSYNNGPAKFIVNNSGEEIPGGQVEKSKILLSWNEASDQWVLLSNDIYSDLTKVIIPVDTDYSYVADHDGIDLVTIPNYNSKTDKLSINFGQTILRKELDYRNEPYSDNQIRLINFTLNTGDVLNITIVSYTTTMQRGHLKYELASYEWPVTIIANDTSVVYYPDIASDAHSITVNYNQTMLRNGIDYEVNELKTGIHMLTFNLNKDDVILFTVTKFIETTETRTPNNWGSTGNYRYQVNVINSGYTAIADNITVIPVPKFDYKRDSLTVIRNNQLYVPDIDYRLDDIGQVVLLKSYLNIGDSIYFTILEGAMVDAPNFNTAPSKGIDGKDLLINISYSELVDYYSLLIKLNYDLEDSPTIKFVEGPAEPILNSYDQPLTSHFVSGSYLWVVYNFAKHCWYCTNNSTQTVASAQRIENKVYTGISNYIGQITKLENGAMYLEQVIDLPNDFTDDEINTISVNTIEPPGKDDNNNLLYIGDHWEYVNNHKLYVGNNGTSNAKFRWTITLK